MFGTPALPCVCLSGCSLFPTTNYSCEGNSPMSAVSPSRDLLSVGAVSESS